MLCKNAHGPTMSEATSLCVCAPVVRLKAGNHYLDMEQGDGEAGKTRGKKKKEKLKHFITK